MMPSCCYSAHEVQRARTETVRLAGPSPRMRTLTLASLSSLVLLIGGWGQDNLQAQIFERALVLEGVHLPAPDGTVQENANIILRGGRIAEMGPDADAPMMSRKMKVKGLFATAGMTDLFSTLTLDAVSSASAVHSAWDGFDRYDSERIMQVLSNGVTRVHLVPMGAGGIVGRACSVSLGEREGGGHGNLDAEDVALCIDLDTGTPLQKIRTFEKVRSAFLAAERRRDAFDDYSSDLEEYIKELSEAAKKKAESEGKEEKGDDKKSDDEEEKDKDKDKDKEEEKGPEKPGRPERNPASDILLQALDHELPVMITARRSQDLQNALDLIEEFGFIATIQGADEAHLMLEALQEMDHLSILLDVPRTPLERGSAPRQDAALISRLEDSGIEWSVASGGESTSLWRSIQMIAGQADGTSPLQLALAQGARGRGAGWLRRGSSEVVLWDKNPVLDPLARPQRVIIDGTVVWQRPAGTREGSF